MTPLEKRIFDVLNQQPFGSLPMGSWDLYGRVRLVYSSRIIDWNKFVKAKNNLIDNNIISSKDFILPGNICTFGYVANEPMDIVNKRLNEK
jgi:hypothetical protein